jgi:hypothetical protein
MSRLVLLPVCEYRPPPGFGDQRRFPLCSDGYDIGRELLRQDGDAFEESVIRKVEGFGPNLCHRAPPISPDFLSDFTAFTLDPGGYHELDDFLCEFLLSALELLSSHDPQYCTGLIENEIARMIALVETFQIRDTCEMLTGHLMAAIRELVVYGDPRPVPWAIHELEHSCVRTAFWQKCTMARPAVHGHSIGVRFGVVGGVLASLGREMEEI